VARLGLQRQAEAEIALEFGSNLGGSVTVRPSFAMSTASGSYKVIIALTLPELNRSRSDAAMPSGAVGSE
jgi:hypothetical protein